MNINEIEKILHENLPSHFHTLSSSSIYHVEISRLSLIITTRKRRFKLPVNNLYELIVDVVSIGSFDISQYKYRHKHLVYLLPIVKFILINTGNDIYSFGPPKCGWRKELSRPYLDDNFLLKDISSPAFEYETIEREMCSDAKISSILKLDDKKIENVLVDVNYATNRKRSSGENIFSCSRDKHMNYGIATVSIPKNEHRSGHVERPLGFLGITFRENKNRHFVLESRMELNESDFINRIKSNSNGKKLIIFVHGYNVSFKDAIFKAAQIKYDLMFDFPILLFSWPSKGNVKSYVSDKESALYSSIALNELLQKISSINIEEIMVIGHSMGTFCLAEALRLFNANNVSFKRLILAAADIQKEAFLDTYAHKIIDTFDMVSLYASSSDRALIASKLINEFERAGDIHDDILVIDNMESIDMSGADNSLFSLRHSYISESNKALDDMYHFLINGLPASKRRLKEMFNKEKMKYWSIPN